MKLKALVCTVAIATLAIVGISQAQVSSYIDQSVVASGIDIAQQNTMTQLSTPFLYQEGVMSSHVGAFNGIAGAAAGEHVSIGYGGVVIANYTDAFAESGRCGAAGADVYNGTATYLPGISIYTDNQVYVETLGNAVAEGNGSTVIVLQ